MPLVFGERPDGMPQPSREMCDTPITIPRGNLKRIHVNQHVVKRNAKTGEREAPITIKANGTNVRCHAVVIDGPSAVVYSPDKPLQCGARLWVETRAELVIKNP